MRACGSFKACWRSPSSLFLEQLLEFCLALAIHGKHAGFEMKERGFPVLGEAVRIILVARLSAVSYRRFMVWTEIGVIESLYAICATYASCAKPHEH